MKDIQSFAFFKAGCYNIFQESINSGKEATFLQAQTNTDFSQGSVSSNILLFLAMTSDNPEYDALYLTNYANLHIVDELSRVDGVGGVSAFGAGTYSLRVWLDPDKMQARNLTPQDVMSVIESQNMAVASGNIGAPPAVFRRFFSVLFAAPRWNK